MKIQSQTLGTLKKWVMLVVLLTSVIAFDAAMAQPDLGTISTQVSSATSQVRTIVNTILGAITMVCLIGVVYNVMSNKDPKTWIIGLVTGLIVWIIAFAVVK